MTSSRRHHLKVRIDILSALFKCQWNIIVNFCINISHIHSSSSLQSLMLQIAANWIEQERKDIEAAKEAYMAENCPDPDLSGDQAALMVRR